MKTLMMMLAAAAGMAVMAPVNAEAGSRCSSGGDGYRGNSCDRGSYERGCSRGYRPRCDRGYGRGRGGYSGGRRGGCSRGGYSRY